MLRRIGVDGMGRKMRERLRGFGMRLTMAPQAGSFTGDPFINGCHSSGSNELNCCLHAGMNIKESFETVEELGAGGSGTVYLVKHTCNNKLYAMKVIPATDELMERLKRELKILRQNDCCHLIRSYAEMYHEGELTLILEYVDGGSLSDVLKQMGHFPESFIASIAKQALVGLEYLHRHRIMHRDMKPANLLVSRCGDVKIADFGSGKIMDNSLTTEQTYVGTFCYMSPTRIRGDEAARWVDQGYKSDIWGLGLTLLECATGGNPYSGFNNNFTLVRAIVENPAPTLPPDSPDSQQPFSAEFHDFLRLWYSALSLYTPARSSCTSKLFDWEGGARIVKLALFEAKEEHSRGSWSWFTFFRRGISGLANGRLGDEVDDHNIT